MEASDRAWDTRCMVPRRGLTAACFVVLPVLRPLAPAAGVSVCAAGGVTGEAAPAAITAGRRVRRALGRRGAAVARPVVRIPGVAGGGRRPETGHEDAPRWGPVAPRLVNLAPAAGTVDLAGASGGPVVTALAAGAA